MSPKQRAFLELHCAVLLWGFTAILGQKIQLAAFVLVWWRLAITCGVIASFVNLRKTISALPRDLIKKYFFVGCIVTAHWLLFYSAIKLANASVALICLSTTSIMASIAEPLMTGKKIKLYELSLGIIIIPAMIFIAGKLPSSMNLGIFIGLLSAVLVVFFSILNKKLVSEADAMTITFLELGGGLIMLTLLMPFYFMIDTSATFMPQSGIDWVYLVLLSVLCTNIAYWLGVRSLRQLSAFATSLTVNLEPLYGIALAVILLKENKQLPTSFYYGGGIIVFAVLLYPFLRSKFETVVGEEL